MPLFELFRLAKGKLEPSQEKPTSCSDDSSSLPESDFGELAWQNGQVMVQGQCNSREKKGLSMSSNSLTPQSSKLGGEDSARIGNLERRLSDFPTSVPSTEIGMNQEDDMVPWLNYPISGSLQSDYCSDFLPELAGVVAVNEASERGGFGSVAKPGQGQICRDSLISSPQTGNVLEDGTRTRTSTTHLFPSSLPLQSQTSFGSSLKLQRSDSAPSSSSSSMPNFSYFWRPTAILKSNNESGNKMGSSGLLGLERAWSRDMDCAVDMTNTNNLNPVASGSGLPKEPVTCRRTAVPQQRAGPKMSDVKFSKEPVSAQKNEAIILEDASKDDKFSNQSWRPGGTKGGLADGEKTLEHVGGSSSICSGNSVERTSDDLKHGSKRKSHETEDSEGGSEDVEEELVSTKKKTSARDSSSRRSRAAEVHNLSERRRRDRINEKMRALQELIPNSNKVDKASMLDEAIEYVKTLKFQLQMMSMGAGLYMPAMMLPTGMQHMGHMPHFPNMGMGMGMGRGLEFGMGIPHMNMQGPQFPGPPISGMHAFPGPNLQMYGLHGQGLPFRMSRAPLVPFSGGPVMKNAAAANNNTYGVPGPVENQDPAAVSSGKESMLSINKQSTQNSGSSCLTKLQLRSQSGVVESSGQALDKKSARGVTDSASRNDPGPKASVL